MPTELEKLKKKRKAGKITAMELKRLKALQDSEPLSQDELNEARKREETRQAQEIEEYNKKKSKPQAEPDPALDKPETPDDHPRITKLKDALRPFTMLDANDSRPDDFILVRRGGAITAGDVRAARKAMNI
jgi:hypothetical protein